MASPLLREPDFRRFWLGQTVSVFGDQVTQLGLPLVAVLVLGADATQMGTLLAVGLRELPQAARLEADAGPEPAAAGSEAARTDPDAGRSAGVGRSED
jgi:hypothetical protein